MTSRAALTLLTGVLLTAGLSVGLLFCASGDPRPSGASAVEQAWADLGGVPLVAAMLREVDDKGVLVQGDAFVAGRARLSVRLGPTAEATFEIRIAGRSTPLRVRRVGAAGARGARKGGAIVYPEVWAGADVTVFERGAGVVEELVTARNAGTAIEYELDLPAGWTIAALGPALAEVRDGEGRGVARVRADRAFDADGGVVAVHLAVNGRRVRVEPESWGHAPLVVDPSWEAVGAGLVVARELHTATPLPSGGVLVVGGLGLPLASDGGAPDGQTLASAELFDPAHDSFALADAGLATARNSHTATPLTDGRILVAGGYGGSAGGPLSSVELYQPGTGTFTAGPSMATSRVGHTATRLLDGTVLLAGGLTADGSDAGAATATADLFDPVAGTMTAVGPMAVPRAFHTASLLPDGRVVFAGGSAEGEIEIYSGRSFAPAMGTSKRAAIEPRRDHLAFVDPVDDVVFFTGGTETTGPEANGGIEQTDQVLDLATMTVSSPTQCAGGDPDSCAPARFAAGIALSDRALVVGGEVAGPTAPEGGAAPPTVTSGVTTDAFPLVGESQAPALLYRREHHTVTALADGSLLVVGGTQSTEGPSLVIPFVERYMPDEDGTAYTRARMTSPRFLHTSTLMPDGRVLVAGGCSLTPQGLPVALAGADRYKPGDAGNDSGDDFPVADTIPLLGPRAGHTATALSNGGVLLVGGAATGGAGAELYIEPNPATTPVEAPELVGCVELTSTLLADGTVLVAGGACPPPGQPVDAGLVPTSAAFIIDPSQSKPAAVGIDGGLNIARQSHAAVRLSDGTVLIAGGVGTGNENGGVAQTEIYDPTRKTFTPSGALTQVRVDPSAVLVGPATVLIAGGADPSQGQSLPPLSSTDVFDLTSHTSTVGPPMFAARYRHSATPLPDGRIAYVGGDCLVPPAYALADDPAGICDSFGAVGSYACGGTFHSVVEVFDPSRFSFSALSGSTVYLGGTGEQAATTLLATGDLLVTGGNDAYPLDSAEVVTIRTSPLDAYSAVLSDAGITSAPGSKPTLLRGSGLAGLIDRSGGSPASSRAGVMQATWVPLSTGLAIPTTIAEWNTGSAVWYPPVTPSLGPGIVFPTVDGVRGAGAYVALAVESVGMPCGIGEECAMGFCVDSVCCNTACDDTCMDCSTGTCQTAADGTKDLAHCGVASCGNTGLCAGGQCAQAPTGSTCTTGEGTAAVCESDHKCVARCAVGMCGAYACDTDGGLCATSCTSNADCATNYLCTPRGSTATCSLAGALTPPAPNGCAMAPGRGAAGPTWLPPLVACAVRRITRRGRRTVEGRRGSTRGTRPRGLPARGG